ncbi:MAG: hypothetical protein OEW30_15010, partial [Acidimicrobiia bacterium]|nr:hypothetical protein [Acidimicrobiia bacterium]
AGIVLVDPMPVGFPAFLDATLDDAGHPAWTDLSADLSASLGDLGDVPLTVIGQDPQAVFLSDRAIAGFGDEKAHAINTFWQQGLEFYSGLAPGSVAVVAEGTGMNMVVWDRPDLVVNAVTDILARG